MTMTDDDFYRRDRPENASLPEDRPRGGQGGAPLRRPTLAVTVLLIIAIIVVVALGIMLFP
ncbi:hypothetical protein [Streptomyces clavuligerus]|nr:hypothetical protein [Streptomyces clavuligerus]ANW16939.1 hypothetical protein BB341_01195 [Streptomyces clavuligerus]AXU11468.1 hypothetical protein D1794_01270 [Streptomyces clavuligerus]QCS04340.1 hypothetical protein CRV15_01270 [Streptomyces clavuligerus]